MRLGIFAVQDAASGAFLQPMFMRSNGEALRSFAAAANEEGHSFKKFAKDYTLFRIGEFDDQTGVIEACTPVSLGSALQYLTHVPSMEGRDSRQIDIEEVIRNG